jgi:glucose-1-phosphate thymidylyltransferase
MKGIILAGGSGTRLFPLTQFISKQLLPIYDKPTIYYPLSILMLTGITEILIISTPRDLVFLKQHFKTGKHLGLSIEYIEQLSPKGIPEAFILGENFIGNDPVVMILGDNIFYGNGLAELLKKNYTQSGATLFAYHVNDPERYGVLNLDSSGKLLRIEEKPQIPPSRWAVTGLYCYDSSVVQRAKSLIPSKRGETEITDLNNLFIQDSTVNICKLSRGVAWLDSGTCDALLDASMFVKTIQERQGFKIACLEEIAFQNGFISLKNFENLILTYPLNSYRQYLEQILKEKMILQDDGFTLSLEDQLTI